MCSELSKSDFAPRAGWMFIFPLPTMLPASIEIARREPRHGAKGILRNISTELMRPRWRKDRWEGSPDKVHRAQQAISSRGFDILGKTTSKIRRNGCSRPQKNTSYVSTLQMSVSSQRVLQAQKMNSRQRWILTKVPVNVVVRGLLFVHKDGQSTD
jgi:hypothetical protein